jgi:hypothetical protein
MCAKLFKLLGKNAVSCQTTFLWIKLLDYVESIGTSTRFVCSANVGGASNIQKKSPAKCVFTIKTILQKIVDVSLSISCSMRTRNLLVLN